MVARCGCACAVLPLRRARRRAGVVTSSGRNARCLMQRQTFDCNLDQSFICARKEIVQLPKMTAQVAEHVNQFCLCLLIHEVCGVRGGGGGGGAGCGTQLSQHTDYNVKLAVRISEGGRQEGPVHNSVCYFHNRHRDIIAWVWVWDSRSCP